MPAEVRYANGTEPAAPAAGQTSTFSLSTTGQMQAKAGNGLLMQLTPIDRPNLLVNSGLWLALRQAAGTLATYSSTAGRAFGPDQWAFTNENASVQYIRVDTDGGAGEAGLLNRFYGTVSKITATGKIEISQCIEAIDAQALRGRSVRFQAWMKASTNTNMRLGLIQLTNAGTSDTIPATFISAHGGASTDPTLGTNLSYIAPKAGITNDNCSTNGNAADCALTTAWQRFGAVFDVPATCKNLIVMLWSNAQITNGASVSWSQASLTDGMEIQDWNPQSIAVERARCLRYYKKSFLDATLPATNVGANTGEAKGIAGKATAVANAGFIFVRHDPPMRVAPGVTLFNPQAANALMRDQTAGADMGATSTTANTANDLMINATGVAGTAVGNQVGIHYTAEAGL